MTRQAEAALEKGDFVKVQTGEAAKILSPSLKSRKSNIPLLIPRSDKPTVPQRSRQKSAPYQLPLKKIREAGAINR